MLCASCSQLAGHSLEKRWVAIATANVLSLINTKNGRFWDWRLDNTDLAAISSVIDSLMLLVQV